MAFSLRPYSLQLVPRYRSTFGPERRVWSIERRGAVVGELVDTGRPSPIRWTLQDQPRYGRHSPLPTLRVAGESLEAVFRVALGQGVAR